MTALTYAILFKNVKPFTFYKVSLMESGKGKGKQWLMRANDDDGNQYDSIAFAKLTECQNAMRLILEWSRA